MAKMMNALIYTNENCVGCNKCIKVCACIGASVSTAADENGKSSIHVNPDMCVACGACFDACEHNARSFEDDTEEFFADLSKGESISVLIAPAFKANYPEQYESVLGGLKALGVKHFINVSFGADITTWGYINYIQKNDFKGGISQPCPALVTYIEKYLPELLPQLFPVQSPLMCAAIYAKTQMNITDRLAFISPCIAKKLEIDDPNNNGYVSYNVTFDHLMKYINEHHISGAPCSDEMEYGLGFIYPMPGGLAENVRWLLGEKEFVQKAEGEKRLYQYLTKNADRIQKKETPFLFIDALNCSDGCLCGTGTESSLSSTQEALYHLLDIRQDIQTQQDDVWAAQAAPDERLCALNKQFEHLDLNDYIRTYTDRSEKCRLNLPDEDQLEQIFLELKKHTPQSRHIDCSSCGYESCHDMALAIFNGFNHKGNCVHYLKSMIEEEKELVRYKAEHDTLLGIWTRHTIENMIRKRISKDDTFSLVMTDINDFKGVNATFGHETADDILKYIVRKLSVPAKAGNWILSRYGGDELLIFIPGKTLTEDSEEIRQIIDTYCNKVPIGSQSINMTISVGIANSDGITMPKDLILQAENAMYAAKSNRHNTVFVFGDSMKEQEREEARVKAALQDAFQNDGFFMVYQPQINSETKRVSGYEALVRMKQSGIYPGQFIPIAEKNGWIWKIGRVTTELSVRQLAKWRDAGHKLHPVSINFSSNQLHDTGYVDFLEKLMKDYRIPPELVEIEITEGIFLDNSPESAALFDRFKKLGIKLLMDDFGTGYSSLGYLTYIPVDVIKLDKSLVDTYLVDGKDNFIKNVIRLVHDLNKDIIIEGVEEAWQFERLREFKADTIQGYFFSKPIPADEAIVFEVK